MITVEREASLTLYQGQRAWRASWTAVWWLRADARSVIHYRVWGRTRAFDAWLQRHGYRRAARGIVVRVRPR